MLILMVRGTFTLQTTFDLHSCSICSYNFFIHVLKTCKKITKRFHKYVAHRLELQVPTLVSKIWTKDQVWVLEMGLETRTKVPVFSKNSNGTWIGILIFKKLELRFLKKKLEKGLKPGVYGRLIGNEH